MTRIGCCGIVALIAACTGAPDVKAPEEVPAIQLLGHERTGRTSSVVARVLRASMEAQANGETRILIDLAVDNDSESRFDGARTYPSAWAIPRAKVLLSVDGTLLPPTPIDEPGYQPKLIEAGIGGNRRARGLLAYDLPQGWSPEHLELHFNALKGRFRVPVLGHLTLEDGTPAHAIQLLGSDLRPLTDATVTVQTGDEEVVLKRSRADQDPWLVPLLDEGTSATFTFSAPDYTSRTETYSAQDLSDTFVVQLTPKPSLGDTEAGLRSTLPAQLYDRSFSDVEGVADTLASIDEVATWVREHIAVLPTHGIQRSSDAVARLRAGSPIERATFTMHMLKRLGLASRVVCGDLTQEQADGIFSEPMPLPPLEGPLAEVIARAQALADEAVPAIEAALADAERPTSSREIYQLVPEWCWVQVRDVSTWRDLDLRPEPWTDTPLPTVWRSGSNFSKDVWKLDIRVLTVHIDRSIPVEDDGIVPSVTKEILSHQTDAVTLSTRAVALDIWPESDGDTGARRRSMLSLFSDSNVDSELGSSFDLQDLDRLILEVEWKDPENVSERDIELPIWQRESDDDVLERLRVILTGDSGTTTDAHLARRSGQAFGGRHVSPAVLSAVAKHDLFSMLRHHAAAGVVPAEPSLLISTFDHITSTSHTFQLDDATPPGAARTGGRGTDAQIARYAAANAAAIRVLHQLDTRDQVESLSTPDTWLQANEPIPEATRVPQSVRTAARRRMHDQQSWVLVNDTVLWVYDIHAASLAPFPSAPQYVETSRPRLPAAEVALGAPARAHLRWDRPLRCLDAPLWRRLLFGDDVRPSGCSDALDIAP